MLTDLAKGAMASELLKRTGASSMTITYNKARADQYYNINREEKFTDGEIDDIKLIHLILVAHHPRINAIRRLAMMVLEDVKDDEGTIREELHPETIAIFDQVDSIRQLDEAKENFTGKWKKSPVDEAELSRIDMINEMIKDSQENAEQYEDGEKARLNQQIIDDVKRGKRYGKGNKEGGHESDGESSGTPV